MAIPVLPPDDEIRRIASEILDQGAYRLHRVELEAWRNVFERVAGWFNSFSLWAQRLHLDSPLLYWALLAALALIAIGLLAHVAYTIRAALIAPSPDRPRRLHSPGRDLVGEAEGLAAEGRYLEAARRVESACLQTLLERGTLELSRSDPNRVLRRRIARAAIGEPERYEFLRLIDRIEARVFRDREEDSELYHGWHRFYRGLHGVGGST